MLANLGKLFFTSYRHLHLLGRMQKKDPDKSLKDAGLYKKRSFSVSESCDRTDFLFNSLKTAFRLS